MLVKCNHLTYTVSGCNQSTVVSLIIPTKIISFLAFEFTLINDFTEKEGVFKHLAELFENYIYSNTVHTKTLYTLLVTITRPDHRLSKASTRRVWQPPFEFRSDSRSQVDIRKRLK